MEEIRSMWCETLEELLQCPVCLEVSQGTKVQCINGHHICNACKIHLQMCPICKSSFLGTRNLAVEQISAKLEDMKLSLMNPYHELNRRILHNKICVATQTESISMPSTACQTEPINQDKSITLGNEQRKLMLNLAPRVGKGSYPCRIGSCTMELVHGRMIGHLRSYHKDVFYEFSGKDNIVKKSWDLEYILNRDYDFAFHIKDMGLFFLNISVNRMGDVMAFLRLVNCIPVCKQFIYTFETVGSFIASYIGPVKSCRISKECYTDDYLRIPENKMRLLIDNNNYFRCNLTIKRRVDYCRKVTDQNNSMHATDDIVDN